MSLADLLVSLAVLGLVLGAAYATLDAGQRLHAIGAARVEAQQTARVALARLAADLRLAGFGAAGGDFPALSVAEPTRLVLHQDVDGDGLIAANGETVTWHLAAGGVLRRNAGGGAQPVINGVRALRFDYLDAGGLPTAVPAAVRTVVVTLTTAPAKPPPGPARGLSTVVTTQVRLRNR